MSPGLRPTYFLMFPEMRYHNSHQEAQPTRARLAGGCTPGVVCIPGLWQMPGNSHNSCTGTRIYGSPRRMARPAPAPWHCWVCHFCKDSYRTMHFDRFSTSRLGAQPASTPPHQIQERGDLAVELSQICRAFGRSKALTLGHCQDRWLWD